MPVPESNVWDFLLFVLVGFAAQAVDGALGMAYGVISSTALLSLGVSPAFASASVHAAEVFTTAASAGSHIALKNIDWRLFWRLMPFGVAGGVLGAFVLTSFPGEQMKPFITAYLALIGVYIIFRAFRRPPVLTNYDVRMVAPLGTVGGFVDAVGGGGWGPVVTSTLVGAGGAPRYVVGTVNAVEFFLTSAVSSAFLVAVLTGHWEGVGLPEHALAVAGLIVGGLLAAPLAGVMAKNIPPRTLMLAIGCLISLIAGFQTWQALT